MCEVVLRPGVAPGSRVDFILVLLVFGREPLDGAPAVGVPRSGAFWAISGTIFLVAGDMKSIAGAMVTEMGVVGLVPVVLVPRKQIP